jgi:hypothetical protein
MTLATTFTSPAYVHFTMLLRAIQHGEIKPSREESEMHSSQLARADLVVLAKKKRDWPLFLFPNRRAKQPRAGRKRSKKSRTASQRDETAIKVETNYGQVAGIIHNRPSIRPRHRVSKCSNMAYAPTKVGGIYIASERE